MNDESPVELPIARDLFDLLCCPVAHTPLKYADGRLVSTDPVTRHAYRIDDGVPIMLVDEAETLDEQAWQRLMDGPGPVGGGVAAVFARAPGVADAG